MRAYTNVGAGVWSNASAPLKVVGLPGFPKEVSASSGTSGETFIEVDWYPPQDTGDLRNDTIPIIDYQIQFSNENQFLADFTSTTSIVMV